MRERVWERQTDRQTDRQTETDRQTHTHAHTHRYFTQSGASVYDCEWVQVRRVSARACCQQTL